MSTSISFASMNNPYPAVEALKHFLLRMTVGGCILLDDYAFKTCRSQFDAINDYCDQAGRERPMTLPTGQGLLVCWPKLAVTGFTRLLAASSSLACLPIHATLIRNKPASTEGSQSLLSDREQALRQRLPRGNPRRRRQRPPGCDDAANDRASGIAIAETRYGAPHRRLEVIEMSGSAPQRERHGIRRQHALT
jgi:hypothetical protein